MDKDKEIVISLGGSIIIPEEVDVLFVNEFVKTIKEYVAQGFSFVIITGGGKICRKYNDALKNIIDPSDEELDWLGISATRLNAEFIRLCFGNLAHERIIMDPDAVPQITRPILVGGGWKPGNSSDLAAIHCAKSVQARKVINLSNIDFVYDKDPRNFPEAKPIKEIFWKDFRKNILPSGWNPGINVPFDPVAAEEAEARGIEVAIMNGKNIENLKNYLDGKEFQGTVIK